MRDRVDDLSSIAGPVPPHMTRIVTRDADEHYAWIASRYSNHERTVRPEREGFEFLAESGEVGAVTLVRTRYTAATAHVTWPPVPFVSAGRLLSGRYQIRWAGGHVTCAVAAV